MKKLIVRMATNEEGARVQSLADPDNCFPGVKWDNIYPYWTVIEDEGDIIACAQVVTSHPIGYIEFLSFDPYLSAFKKARAIKLIQENAQLLLYGSGVYVARSCVPFRMKKWKKIVKKNWGKRLYDGNVFAMRIN